MASPVSISIDTSGLQAVIPQLVSFGRRTVAEQCVTSMGMILQDAQVNTPFVDLGRMDAELDADRTPARTGNRTATQRFIQSNKLGGLPWTEGMMIALQRTNPNSPFSVKTGNRWPLVNPGFRGGFRTQERWRFFVDAAERMKLARHSSSHFLQSGYKAARDMIVSSPLFRNKYRQRSGTSLGNNLDAGKLGKSVIELTGDQCIVISENNVGEHDSTPELNLEHRRALLAYSAGPLQDAVTKETLASIAELEKRLSEKWPQFNLMLK